MWRVRARVYASALRVPLLPKAGQLDRARPVADREVHLSCGHVHKVLKWHKSHVHMGTQGKGTSGISHWGSYWSLKVVRLIAEMVDWDTHTQTCIPTQSSIMLTLSTDLFIFGVGKQFAWGITLAIACTCHECAWSSAHMHLHTDFSSATSPPLPIMSQVPTLTTRTSWHVILPQERHMGVRMLDPFVAYIGKTCGQGLLGCRQLGRIGAGLVRVPTNPVLHVGSIIYSNNRMG